MEQRKLTLTKRLKDYTDVRTAPGEDQIMMLYIENVFICSVAYAEAMSDDDLRQFISDTLEAQQS